MNKEEMMDKIFDRIQEEKLGRALERINKIVEEVFEENDEYVSGIEEIIEDYISDLLVKPMYIQNVVNKKTDNHYLQIEIPDSDGEYQYVSRFKIKEENDNEMVSIGLIMKLREMAWLGYELRQSKEWEEKEI